VRYAVCGLWRCSFYGHAGEWRENRLPAGAIQPDLIRQEAQEAAFRGRMTGSGGFSACRACVIDRRQ
ncbi:MAG: hypothetical protein ABGW82_08895, partial [Paracoccus sp. (in: a-proteobacteria)]